MSFANVVVVAVEVASRLESALKKNLMSSTMKMLYLSFVIEATKTTMLNECGCYENGVDCFLDLNYCLFVAFLSAEQCCLHRQCRYYLSLMPV